MYDDDDGDDVMMMIIWMNLIWLKEKKNISTVNVLSGKNSAFLIKGSFCANVSFSTVKFVMNHSEKHLHNNERD